MVSSLGSPSYYTHKVLHSVSHGLFPEEEGVQHNVPQPHLF